MASPIIDNVYRPPYEYLPAVAAFAAAGAITIAPHIFLLTPKWALLGTATLGCLGAIRLKQARRISLFRRNVKRLPSLAMTPEQIPVSDHAVYLGKGFNWSTKHAQRLYLASLPENEHLHDSSWLYKKARAIERGTPAGQDTWLTKLTKTDAWWNPVAPLPPVGGAPILHGVEVEEEDVFTALAELNNHTIVYGTTRVGKTRLAQILITQDIRRGDVVIVMDPKGDVDLLLGMYADAVAAGREKDFFVFHLGFPEISARYNPIGAFEQITEVASRTTNPLPDEGQSSAFKAFAWRYVNVIARAMAAIGEKPDFAKIYRYGVNIDDLARNYLEQYLDSKEPGWRDRFDPTPTKDMKDLLAKAAKNGRDTQVVMLTQYFREKGHTDQVADALISVLSNDRTYFEKLVSSLYPLMEKLTSGKLAELISPNYFDTSDPRPIIDWMSIINRGGIVYMGLDALSIPDVAQTVAAAGLADLTSVAGSIYKHTSSYGMSRGGRRRRIRLHADELNELIGPEFVQLANKAGGADVNITGYTQTGQDIEAKVGNAAKAGQIGGNLNTLIMLRVKNKETAEILTNQLPEVDVLSVTPGSRVSDTNDPTEFADFASASEDRISREKVPLVDPAMLTKLPKGQAFALIEGGQLKKIRIPLPLPTESKSAPSNWNQMLSYMRANYSKYLESLGEAAELTVEGKGIGY
ncbi:hypothetical protein JY96_21495 [Aquabacterium sp. NJ1]|uniref:type IV conjugative transfer system coupling protein TraD n=1 Tax=Aquabacterium sp. NJ1 TaxID=1538295 RepID=UPI00052D5E78|nr:type IV conjugative transfer system coupling protein TraD [Aquabacterium sp. NJ1]KGM38741.1 hypothetical protein JY96_21495 [Aquabacterium sp. NJ1]